MGEQARPDDKARVLAHSRACIEAPAGVYEDEFRLRRKDGAYRWMYTRAEVLRNAAGRPQRMLGVPRRHHRAQAGGNQAAAGAVAPAGALTAARGSRRGGAARHPSRATRPHRAGLWPRPSSMSSWRTMPSPTRRSRRRWKKPAGCCSARSTAPATSWRSCDPKGSTTGGCWPR